MAHYPYGLQSLSPGTSIDKVLARLGSFREVPIEPTSQFVRPASVLYELDGKERRWDIVKSHASVGVVLYHRGRDAFIVVRQFRPAVYAARCRAAAEAGAAAPPKDAGFTFELCAGLVDKGGKSVAQITSEEIEEECGFRVAPDSIVPVTSAIASSGTTGAEHFISFAAVDESARIGDGGGIKGHGEAIEVLSLPFESALPFALDASLPKSPGLMFGLAWAYHALRSGELGGRATLEGGELRLRETAEGGALDLRSVLPS